ncbi:MAG TPA: flagellar motor stator protein MotA [Novimethylophilus sp.]|jgi:chemotaxis protein MotA|uniref:flagellar motor stator protein MotA n=1 Tax=Novimethylophilus sp. TaxID=2137426 RepID=UPI002F3E2413
MSLIIGALLVLGSIIGGFVLEHGHLAALFQPVELLIIGGAAFGAFLIANPTAIIKSSFAGVGKVFKGSSYNKTRYMELLGLMYALFGKIRKDGLIALEADIEEPEKSQIFAKYPGVLADHHVLDFICDYFRMMVGGSMNAFEIENLMDLELETHHQEAHKPIAAIQSASDALPAFGIVAAVLGVVITMGAIGGPPEELGHKVGAALVGTMLGILLSYGFVGPLASSLNHQLEDESKFYVCIKTCIIAYLNGYAPQVAVEFGRKALFSDVRPGFLELEEHVKQKK